MIISNLTNANLKVFIIFHHPITSRDRVEELLAF